MSNWISGMPVVTGADIAAWKLWRAERRRELQRYRRQDVRRIDFYPDEDALRAIGLLWQPRREGRDQSTVLNAIAADWLKLRGL